MNLPRSTVGRKLVMAVSGFSMIVFVVLHLLGNTTMYHGADGINAYARMLRSVPALLWTVRLTMLIMLSLHVFYGIQLTLENRAAKPQGYARKTYRQSTFAARNVIWTGLLIAAFIIYHLLHFTFQVTNPEISASRHYDMMGRPDVFTMVVLSFQDFFISAAYGCSMFFLALHLLHAIQSSFQTVGLNTDRTFPVIVKAGTYAAMIIFLGYIAFPVAIFTGLLK